MKIVFMFPGQSSRYPEMLMKLIDHGAENRAIVRHASDVLERNLEQHFAPDNTAMFDRNQDIQVGVFLANYIHGAMLRARGIAADISLGLSLGEYNHLVDIEALPFEAALRLVAARGALYDQGPEGAMAAVGPIDLKSLNTIVETARRHGAIEVAVENSPNHHVIAGSSKAVDVALGLLEDGHFVQGALIEDHLPMHTSSFSAIAERFRPHLENVPWRSVRRPYFPNDTAEPIAQPSGPVLVGHLVSQVFRPVKWRQSIETIARLHPDAIFVEAGPRSVLYNLLQSRWMPNRKFKSDGVGNELEIDAICDGLQRLANW